MIVELSYFFKRGELNIYIYKITNDINEKMYIGQTINSVEERFKRHINSAISNELDTHFARAIRKLGPEHFKVEIIDTATTQDELTEKEYYQIRYYDAVHKGYNETENKLKCGGNTYAAKTDAEMDIIREKIRQTKIGEKNPRAVAVKCKNVISGEILHFKALSEMQKFFNESNHSALGRRCAGKIKSLYKNVWQIAYENDIFSENIEFGRSTYNSKKVKVINLDCLEEKVFKSFSAVEKEYNLPKGKISKKKNKQGSHFIINNLEIMILE